jgi:DNA topoisomerase-1
MARKNDKNGGLEGVIVDPEAASRAAGLSYVSDEEPGIRRRRAGTGFAYRDAKGRRLTDKATIERIRKLAIPPAYTNVWICPDPEGHIQATGRDAKGRKQYRYHPRWREVRDSTKYERLVEFARALPRLRARIAQDMAAQGLTRERVLATVVHLLETTLIRVGNEDYARENKSYGLTTLRTRHVEVNGGELRFQFKGKSGKEWRLKLRNQRVAKVIRACQELPGQHLFQYLDAEGERQQISSTDVNAYLREISGSDITAKDFRTWAGTVLAAIALKEVKAIDGDAATKSSLKAAIERVAARLGNTPTICRKCYVHPEVVNAYIEGTLLEEIDAGIDKEFAGLSELSPEEAAVLTLLKGRIGRDLKSKLKRSVATAAA